MANSGNPEERRPLLRRALGAFLPRHSRLRRALAQLAPPPPPRKGPAPSYTEKELLERAEEFNVAAEAYWKDVAAEPAGRTHAFSKPLTTVPDASGILYRVGLILQAADLGVGHTVLDLGAGGCWLSSYLNRLGCRTIAVDVSPTALDLGRQLFAMDPRQRMDLDPQFLPYDGHTVPLPDASVDRVVCFDSFHHVPNQDEILREIFRVLKDGGRAIFAEPGEGHSHHDQSVYETERHGVLENDLDLRELWGRAQRLGFTGMTVKPYPDPGSLAFDADTYFRFMDGDEGVFPMQALQQSLREFYVFVMAKGAPTFDSRNPHLLRAAIEVAPASRMLSGICGQRIAVPVTVRNTGDTTWLHEMTSYGGYVGLGGTLLRESGETDRGFVRVALPRTVKPGESIDLTLDVTLPAERGRAIVRLDMVDEWIAWFAQTGSPTTDLEIEVTGWPDSTAPDRLRAQVDTRGNFNSFRPMAGVIAHF